MDQDQQEKQRHVCKYCNKSFANGKVLGGHMRCHVTKNPLKNQKKLIDNNSSSALIEGGDRTGYGLRVNPKKSSRVSASSDQETTSSSKEIPCRVCGKEFDTMRALFGHMRHHSKRRREMVCCCTECGREFESLRALSCHMKTHSTRGLLMEETLFAESSGLVKRKRSRRSRLKLGSSCSLLSLSESSSTVGVDVDREVEEIAMCLLILSQGISEFSEDDNHSSALEAQSPNPGKRASENGDKPMKKKVRVDQMLEFSVVSGCEGGFLDVKLSKNSEEKEDLSSEIPDPQSGGDLELTRVMIIDPVEIESDEPREKTRFDQDSADQPGWLNSGPETLESSQRRSEYKCRTCNKTFHSHQALGGHQTIHRPSKNFSSSQFDDSPGTGAKYNAEDLVEFEAERVVTLTSFESKEHKCHICFKVFASGQALGGHKRAHMVRDSEAEAEAGQIPLLSHEVSKISGQVIDTDLELKSPSPFWVRNSNKHELLVGLMPN